MVLPTEAVYCSTKARPGYRLDRGVVQTAMGEQEVPAGGAQSLSPHPSLRVFIVADYPMARAGLAALLGEFPDLAVTGQGAWDGALAALIDERAPDALLLDLAARDEEAVERLERLLAARPGLAAVVLVAPGERDGPSVVDLLASGARGVLPREAGAEELAAALRAVAAGLVVLQPTLAAPLLASPGNERPRGPASGGPDEPLTPRELEVLQALAGGLTNRAIARRLSVSENTVKFHVSAILTKLDAASRAEAVALAARRGLLLL